MKEERITLAHGAGGKETTEILENLLFNRLDIVYKRVKGGVGIDLPDDGATIPLPDGSFLVVSTDSYTVKPIRFPGGDIGKLAACGSINDVLVMGGKPIAFLDMIVVEEGVPMSLLEAIVDSMLKVLREERVPLVGGDFKVMPKGGVDGVVIATVALGLARKPIIDAELKPGDRIIVTGPLGEHGATIMALQHGIDAESKGLKSDVKTLTGIMIPLMEKYGEYIHAARDPTRGGLAMTLNDWAKASGTVIVVEEKNIPVRDPVKAYSEMLGIDPLYLACEGVAALGVEGSRAGDILEYLRRLGCCKASIIGEVKKSEKYSGLVLFQSAVGGLRILEPPTGVLVPRIC